MTSIFDQNEMDAREKEREKKTEFVSVESLLT